MTAPASRSVVFEAYAVINGKGQPVYAGEVLAIYPTKVAAKKERLTKKESVVRVRVTVEIVE